MKSLAVRAILFAILAPITLALLPAPARAQEEGYPFRLANFSIEILGGLTRLDPSDLNKAAFFEESYLQYYQARRFAYFAALSGGRYQATTVRTGDHPFAPISDGLAYGLRLRYDLSPSLSLSLGWQALTREQRSNVAASAVVMDPGPFDLAGSSAYGYKNSGFLLGVSAWTPEIAAHFGWDLNPVVRFEAMVGFGPLFVSAHFINDRDSSTTDVAGLVAGTRTTVDMKGTGTGFSGELGARLSVRAAAFLNIFMEGVFAFREASNISGPGSSRAVPYDSRGVGAATVESWTGSWGNLWTEISSAWGKFSDFEPQNKVVTTMEAATGKFALDLSGLQVKAGVSIRL